MDTSIKNKYLELAEKLRISQDEEFAKPQIALKQENLKSDGFTTTGTLGNFSVVIGKAKSRKTFYTGILVSAAINNDLIFGRYKGELPKEQSNVVYFDTEQGKHHVQKAQHRICSLAKKDKSKNLHVYHLRALNPSERLKVIEAVIYENDNIGLVVIDGIRDLVTSINDEEQATNISSKLLKWSEERNIHIIVVLHQNKGNDYARGHLGSELIHKAELVISVTKQKENEDISIVKPEYSRDIEPEPFAFTIIDGLPSAVDNFVEKTVNRSSKIKLVHLQDEAKKKLLKEVFSNKNSFTYSALVKQIKGSFSKLFKKLVGDNQAKYFITECKKYGWINQKTPKGEYTLSSSMDPP
ncbi:AAA family ATPase [uncultured Lutibacter sp.]|uniref:AAA family ATPase n=1 Tax=uncultured Lutibacter sp. TaxID=437739 RepID=UPI0026056665|nr:AAA family ATPase [uncultured Lutibacter sp.]